MAEFVPSILVSFFPFPAFCPFAGSLWRSHAAAARRRFLATTLIGYHGSVRVSSEKSSRQKGSCQTADMLQAPTEINVAHGSLSSLAVLPPVEKAAGPDRGPCATSGPGTSATSPTDVCATRRGSYQVLIRFYLGWGMMFKMR